MRKEVSVIIGEDCAGLVITTISGFIVSAFMYSRTKPLAMISRQLAYAEPKLAVTAAATTIPPQFLR